MQPHWLLCLHVIVTVFGLLVTYETACLNMQLVNLVNTSKLYKHFICMISWLLLIRLAGDFSLYACLASFRSHVYVKYACPLGYSMWISSNWFLNCSPDVCLNRPGLIGWYLCANCMYCDIVEPFIFQINLKTCFCGWVDWMRFLCTM